MSVKSLMKERIHFAHGNGFPSPCYQQVFKYLAPQYECCYIDRVGHTDMFPVQDNWYALVQEVKESIKLQSNGQPVIALGHSLGGVLSVLAAIESPELFKAVILLDSPLLSHIRSRALGLFKHFGLIDNITPAKRTRARRKHWHTREDVFKYLKRRALFKHFTDDCLNDYIDYGMIYDDTGYHLRFDVGIEYQIYRTIPHSLTQFNSKLKVPTVLIYGDKSDVIHAFDRRHMQRKYGITSIKTEGTHMFPFEHPEKTAQLVLAAIEKLTTPNLF